jgi:hypothetical protein
MIWEMFSAIGTGSFYFLAVALLMFLKKLGLELRNSRG